MINIFICDDHKLVVEGIKVMLEGLQEMKVIGYSLNGEDAIKEIRFNEPQILLLDINLPGKNGIEICKLVKTEFPNVKVIGLTMVSELSIVKLLMANGGSGYVLKNTGQQELIDAINCVLSDKFYIDKEVEKLAMLDLIQTKPNPNQLTQLPKLSRREKEILSLIIEEYTTPEVAAKLFISIGTVETHRRNILSKLGARNTAGLVRITLENNLLN